MKRCSMLKEEKVKKIVRESYGKIAKSGCSCCDSGSGKELGYAEE